MISNDDASISPSPTPWLFILTFVKIGTSSASEPPTRFHRSNKPSSISIPSKSIEALACTKTHPDVIFPAHRPLAFRTAARPFSTPDFILFELDIPPGSSPYCSARAAVGMERLGPDSGPAAAKRGSADSCLRISGTRLGGLRLVVSHISSRRVRGRVLPLRGETWVRSLERGMNSDEKVRLQDLRCHVCSLCLSLAVIVLL